MTRHADSQQQITELLVRWGDGEDAALERLTPLVYDELRQLARAYMRRESPGHTLQTTALVNEAYLRLLDAQNIDWKDRAHFFGIAARLMRQILVDMARANLRVKRGAGARPVQLEDVVLAAKTPDQSIVDLDDSLRALAQQDERKSKVVELRFFGGLTVEETAEVLKLSRDTVLRDWKFAKLWLLRELNRQEE